MEISKPIVPIELDYMLDDRVLEIHEQHANRTYEELLEYTEKSTLASLNEHAQHKGGVMIGHQKADFEAGITVYPSSFLQSWKPSKVAQALFLHDVLNPEGVTIILPNNSGQDKYYDLNEVELETLEGGNLVPFYERQVRTVERLLGARDIGEVNYAGFSKGGLVALGMAAVGSDKLSVTRVNSFEAPSEERTPKKLNSDFRKSATPFDLMRAINDASIPSLSESLRIGRLGKDLIRFGLDNLRFESKAFINAMATPNVSGLIDDAMMMNDDLEIVLGYVDGSRMRGDFVVPEKDNVTLVEIGPGVGSHRHATVDNIVANALMMNFGKK